MRRWAATLGAGLILLLAGCSGGAAITDGWGPMPPAKQFRPAAGTCHAVLQESSEQSAQDDYKPIPCGGPHKAETVAVFDLTPAQVASRTPWINTAFAECTKRADAFLGGDWRLGWTVVHPSLASATAQSGGARWVRCDVGEIGSSGREVVVRQGSMKGSLKPGGKLLMGCATSTLTSDDDLDQHKVACASRHDTEFAGLYLSKTAGWEAVSQTEMDKGCYPVLAKFAGIPNDRNLKFRVGWAAFQPDTYSWSHGDHAIRCFLWLDPQKVTGSDRKAGPGRLPIN
jgi:hypothetical protein